jgi:hypothetical protein
VNSWMTRIVGAAVGVATIGVVSATVASPAQAEFGSGSNGFTVSVHVNVSSGSGDPVPSGGITLSVPPKCYWGTSANFDGTDPAAFEKFYKSSLPYLQGSESEAGYYAFPTDAEIKKIADEEKSGKADYTWYELKCQDGVNGATEGYTNSNWTTPASYGALGNQPVPVAFKAFPAGTAPPPPLIDVKDLTTSLWDLASQRLEDPDLARNPTISAVGNATLVNLDTWFWVTNVVGALAQDGKIHLEASIPGTPVQTTLDASTTGVTVTSPVGSQPCTVEEAKQAYSGSSNVDPCQVRFQRANKAGWPVTATINWTGTWRGTDNNGVQAGPLEPQGHTTTINVPVVESQAIDTSTN